MKEIIIGDMLVSKNTDKTTVNKKNKMKIIKMWYENSKENMRLHNLMNRW